MQRLSGSLPVSYKEALVRPVGHNAEQYASSSAVGFDVQVALFGNNKKNHLCLNCLFPNQNDINLPRCETVGISGIAAGMAGLLTAQKTINFILNIHKENHILSLLNVLKGDLQNINLKNNKKCYLNKN